MPAHRIRSQTWESPTSHPIQLFPDGPLGHCQTHPSDESRRAHALSSAPRLQAHVRKRSITSPAVFNTLVSRSTTLPFRRHSIPNMTAPATIGLQEVVAREGSSCSTFAARSKKRCMSQLPRPTFDPNAPPELHTSYSREKELGNSAWREYSHLDNPEPEATKWPMS